MDDSKLELEEIYENGFTAIVISAVLQVFCVGVPRWGGADGNI